MWDTVIGFNKETRTAVVGERLFTSLLFLFNWKPFMDFRLSVRDTNIIHSPRHLDLKSSSHLFLFPISHQPWFRLPSLAFPVWVIHKPSRWSLRVWSLPIPIQPSCDSEIDFSKLQLVFYFISSEMRKVQWLPIANSRKHKLFHMEFRLILDLTTTCPFPSVLLSHT